MSDLGGLPKLPAICSQCGEPFEARATRELREAAQRLVDLEPALRLKVITTATRDWQEAVAALRAALGEPHPQPERRTE